MDEITLNDSKCCPPLLQPADRTLLWRQQQLIVLTIPQDGSIALSTLGSQKLLTDRLRRSPVKLVKLDPVCGTEHLRSWADACLAAGKPMFLRIPGSWNPAKQHSFRWRIKRILDWLGAALLLIVLSPLMLLLAGFLRATSSEPVLQRQWCIGRRGKLFQQLKFRLDKTQAVISDIATDQTSRAAKAMLSSISQWIWQHYLAESPQLLNVLRGEMSLTGPHPLPLVLAETIPLEHRSCLNVLPGLTGIDLSADRSPALDQEVFKQNQRYLQNWSLRADLKYLLFTPFSRIGLVREETNKKPCNLDRPS